MKSFFIKLFSIILISCLGIGVYSNTFHCSFHFDDLFFIVDNNVIKNINNLQNIWEYLPCRFVFYLSLALNYHFDGLNVFGYHLVNLAVHIISSVLVWWLVLLTLSTPPMLKVVTVAKNVIQKKPTNKSNRNLPVSKLVEESVITEHANIIALFAGLVFVSHPIQTQGVTYIMQRAASMATMFYLASLCFYVKSRLCVIASEAKQSFNKIASSPSSKCSPFAPEGSHYRIGHIDTNIYYTFSLIAAILAMFTKEITITLPLIILLYELSFLMNNKKLEWKCLVPFLITLIIIPVTMSFTHNESINAQEIRAAAQGQATDITSGQYLLTQFRVIVTYIRLLFIPLNQNVDYDYHVSQSLFEISTLISFLFLGGLLYGAQRLFSKYRLISFSVFWFFITLLPESSLFPIKDVIFEHRLYLPLVGYSMLLVSSLYYVPQKNIIKAIVVVLAMMIGWNSFLTYQRNKVWQSEFTLWSDAIRKSPHKARAYNNLGKIYLDQGKFAQAMPYFDKAIEMDPNFIEGYANRGVIYQKQGNFNQALLNYNKTIELDPAYPKAYFSRATVCAQLNNIPQALSDYSKAIELNPNYAESYNNRGNILEEQGSYAQAMADFNKAIELNPNYAESYTNRGIAYDKLGNFSQALSDYSKAIELRPGLAGVYNNRGNTYLEQGNLLRALADFNKGIELDPKIAEAYYNRGIIYVDQEKFTDAIDEFTKAIKINPGFTDAYNNRAVAFFKMRDYTQAWADEHQVEKLGAAVNSSLISALKAVTGQQE